MSISLNNTGHSFTEKQRILAVDDDPFIRNLLAEIMASWGYEHDIAEDGLAALDKLEENSYSIVITDVRMPGLNGIDLTKKIKEKSLDIDVIVITAYNADYKYTDVISAGACDFISKPFNINELEAKLHRIIRERELRHELERLSKHDGLTNIYNRRYFNTKLEEESYRAYRQGYDLFLILMDVDRFKEYNDTKGHTQGDTLLRKLAGIILSSVRENVDWGFRYGGDEFAVIVTQAAKEQANKIANRILTKYNTACLQPTSLSIGLAKLHYDPNLTIEENMGALVGRADEALYRAKNAGGNQVSATEGCKTTLLPTS